jgi:predicted transcriptional regulator
VVRYKQVKRTTDLPNGSLSYILKKLENSGSFAVNRADNNRTTAYYPNNIKAND